MTLYYVDGTRTDDTGAGTSEATAKKTIAAGYALLAAGDTLYIKASVTYTLTTTITPGSNGSIASGRIVIEGYTTTPGARDGRPVITSATNSVALITFGTNGSYTRFRHLRFTHTATTRGHGLTSTGASTVSPVFVEDCEFDGLLRAMDSNGGMRVGMIENCKITNCTDTTAAVQLIGTTGSYGVRVLATEISGNAGDGLRSINGWGGLWTLEKCKIFGNTGIGFDEVDAQPTSVSISSCTITANGGSGVKFAAKSAGLVLHLYANVIYGNGGWGVQNLGTLISTDAALLANRNNAYGSNTSGNLSNLSAGTGDVALTAAPFTSTGTGDYSPNSTAGGGALLRAGTNGSFDIGAVQHADPVGSSGGKKRTPQ